VTPPAPMATHASGPCQPIGKRGASPAGIRHGPGALGSHSGQQLVGSSSASQPTRASSVGTPVVPRSNSTLPTHGMPANHQRQPGGSSANAPQPCSHLPGSPSSSSPLVSNSPAGRQPQQPHFGQCSPSVPAGSTKMVFPHGPHIRGTSPMSSQASNAVSNSLPLGCVSRATIGGAHAAAALRIPSPSVGRLSSPAVGSVAAPFGSANVPSGHRTEILSASTRGRSPPPAVVGSSTSSSGLTNMRQPRAVTPSSLVKGITQGIHAGGMVTRGSLGPAAAVHRGLL